MASVETTVNRPVAAGLAGRAEPRPRALGAELVDTPAQRSPHDDDGGIVGLALGSGVLLIQACAIVPGLLPCLLLLLPVVLPLVVLGAAAGLLVGCWRLLAVAYRTVSAAGRRERVTETAQPARPASSTPGPSGP